ncbi:uncharacterized protein LOC131167382 isoform X2 [Malania oleifera]|nr:uncharacterized protein LOC131167382 isoform X2 [Malania oleifera]XP_057982166.1 uncharacterized protein LOC131167382 isoform X2 [Malania oleifera]
MAASNSSASSLPWLWIIEFLSSCKQVDTSLLNALIRSTPDFSDPLGKNAREMASLRCLEDLFATSNSKDVPSAAGSKIGFDFSENCEDVFMRIINEMQTTNWRIAGPDLLKWDVHPFITHKRACLPKSSLEQMKDTIIEGSHPLPAFSKERGLVCGDQCDMGNSGVGGSSNATALKLDRSRLNDERVAEKGKLVPPILENGSEPLPQDTPNRNLLPSKRNRIDLVTENPEEQYCEKQVDTNHDGDLRSHSKKLRQGSSHTSLSVGQNEVTRHGNELLEESSTRIVQSTGGKRIELEKALSVDEAKDDGKPPSRAQQEISDDETRDYREHNFQQGTPNGALLDRSCRNNFPNEMDHRSEPEMMSDSDEYHAEEIDIVKKKHIFLSSQCTSNHDSLEIDDFAELSVCMKCNRGGQLLVCCASACPLAVHENCLGFAASFDVQGNFYCPFCAYSHAISEYLEAKKKATSKRKELGGFIGLQIENQKERHPKILHRKKQNKTRKERHIKESYLANNGGLVNTANPQYGTTEDKQEADVYVEESLVNYRGHLNIVNRQYRSIEDEQQADGYVKESDLKNDGGLVNIVNPQHRIIEDKPQPDGHREESGCMEGRHKADGDHANTVNPQHISREDVQQDQELADPKCNIGSQRHAEVGIKQGVLQQHNTNSPQHAASLSNIDAEETSTAKNDIYIDSRYSMRDRKQERHYAYNIPIPLLRRKKLAWTAEEEKMLKEGMHKFSSVQDGKFPWKKILEFGESVFQKGRTTIDLKDKWRNMCKSSPKLE